MSLTIRNARREDSAAIWAMVEGLAKFEHLQGQVTGSAADFERWIFDEPVASVLVAEQNDRLLGYALFFKTLATFRMKPGIWLEDLFVLEESRGGGIGKALIGAVLDEAREKGYTRVDWSVLDWNEQAIGFYRALGAEVIPDWRICRYNL